MGRNTIHSTTKDLFTAYNETQKFYFKFQIDTSTTENKMELANRFINLSNFTIKINGLSRINQNDKIIFNEKSYKVKQIESFIDEELARFRKDFDNFTGATYVRFY